MILAEITAAIDAAGTLQTFYFASGEYRTKPSDTPANINFLSAMTDPASLGVNVYGNGRTAGSGSLTVGQLKIANNDGTFDALMTYGFDGRPVVLRLHDATKPYALMPILFTGTVDGPPELTRQNFTFRLKDKMQVLEVVGRPNLYGGTNVLPDGIDGTPSDLKGKRLPRIYGAVPNITPDCVNTSLQTFRVNDGPVASIDAVYDKGAPYTAGIDHATSALLNAATIMSGHYDTCLVEGLFRLNAAIAGTITVDVTEGPTAGDRTTAQIVKRIGLSAGLAEYEISAWDVAQLDILQPAVQGIFLQQDETARSAINTLVAGVGAYAVFDISGQLRLGRLSEPMGTPILSLTDSQSISVERQAQQDGDLPISSLTLNHTKVWTVQQPSDLAGVALSRSTFLSSEFRSITADAAEVKQQFLLAPPYSVDSLIYDPVNLPGGPADEEAHRLLALYKVRRDMFVVTVHMDVLKDSGVPSLMSPILLQTPRYGLSAGRLFLLIGFGLELKRSQAQLTLWG